MARGTSAYIIERPRVNLRKVAKFAALLLILALAATLRLLPSRFGVYLDEFDPYVQKASAEFIVKSLEQKGPAGFFDFFSWHNDRSWYPEGVDMRTYFFGVPYCGAIFYLMLRAAGLNITLDAALAIFPVVGAVVSIVFVYLIARKFADETAALVAALFVAVTPAFIGRTALGWFDTESVGIPSMLASLYFFLVAVSKDVRRELRLISATLSGLSAAIMVISWGGAMYLLGVVAIWSILAYLTNRAAGEDLLAALSLFASIVFVAGFLTPHYSLAFLKTPGAIALAAAIVCIALLHSLKGEEKVGPSDLLLCTLVLLVLVGVAAAAGYVTIGGRMLATVFPLYKSEDPLVRSVQEHASLSFAALFQWAGPFVILSLYGLYKNRDPLLIMFFLTTVYFATSLARLEVLAAPAMAIAGGSGISYLLKGTKRTAKYRIAGVTIASLLLLFEVASLIGPAIAASNRPALIASAALGTNTPITDWMEALEWLRDNVPPGTVVAAWWDWGYWLTWVGNVTSLADNGTINGTRIALLARMFLSNETEAIAILKSLGAKYVVIHITVARSEWLGSNFQPGYYTFLHMGEENKFIQMARIAGIDEAQFIDMSSGWPVHKPEFWNTFLGKLIPYEKVTEQDGIPLYRRVVKYPPDASDAPLRLVFESSHKSYAEVLIYELRY